MFIYELWTCVFKLEVKGPTAQSHAWPLHSFLVTQGAFITFFKSRIAFANAFRNAFLELLRLSSLSQNHDYEYTVRPRKTDPWNKGMLWPSAGMAGVYDCSHTFIVKYDHYAFEWYIVEIPPIIHHWAVLFSKLNVKINLFHFQGRQVIYITIVSNMAKGAIKPFWATKQHDLRKLWILFDKFVIYINYFAPFPHVPITILLNVLITKAWPWRVGALSTLHDQHMDWWAVWLESGWGMAIPVSTLTLW